MVGSIIQGFGRLHFHPEREEREEEAV